MIARPLGLLALAAVALGCVTSSRGRLAERGFLFRELVTAGHVYPWAVYVPRSYDPSHPWPLVVFLHGRGESGTDGVTPIDQGIGSAILRNPERWPAIVVFPQKPNEDSEWEQHEAAVLAVVDTVEREYRVDPDRVYLTGISQGGHGTLVLGARQRARWAALVAVCAFVQAPARARRFEPPPFSGTAEELAAGIVDLPLWLFHGDADATVPVAQTRETASALAGLGHPPRVTIYPGVDHNSWDRAYGEAELAVWLLSQRRNGGALRQANGAPGAAPDDD